MTATTSANTPSRAGQTALQIASGFDLTGKVYLITGAYSGLGAATTKALLSAGATVIVTGRSTKAQQAFAEELLSTTLANGTPVGKHQVDASRTCDLGSLSSVRDFAHHILANYKRIDCLIANAGVMNTPYGVTKDGFEVQMATNVIGHFLLAKLLAECTHRQVWMSSMGHSLLKGWPGPHSITEAPRIDIPAITQVDESTYDGWRRYQQSKLGNILLAKQFALAYPHLKTCAVHPGVVRTKLGRHVSVWTLLIYLVGSLFKGGGQKVATPEHGASTQTWCAIMPEAELVNGAYYADCAVVQEAVSARNPEDAKALFDFCDSATRSFQPTV